MNTVRPALFLIALTLGLSALFAEETHANPSTHGVQLMAQTHEELPKPEAPHPELEPLYKVWRLLPEETHDQIIADMDVYIESNRQIIPEAPSDDLKAFYALWESLPLEVEEEVLEHLNAFREYHGK
ncbi:MAG: hypothetical protein AAGF24_03840 [Cyanobacteria bacterium P01_H01_bin.121]